MRRTATLLAALAAILTAAAEPVRTATENFVTNKVAEAVAAIPLPDYSTNNTALVETIEATAPAPGDYAAVSNAAVHAAITNALQDAAISGKQDNLPYPTNAIPYAVISSKPSLATVATSGSYNDLTDKPTIPTVPTNVSAFNNDAGYLASYTETDPTVPEWAKAASKPTYTASEVGAYSANTIDAILQDYLPLDYFKNGQTIPMYWGDGTKLCDFGANWIGNLAADVRDNSDAIDAISDDIPPAVSNVVTTALVRERLGVYLYVGEDGGIYVHTNED